MPIIDYFARGVMQTLGKDDFRRIMNDTLDHMLKVMTRRERVEFINDMVNNAVEKMLTGLSDQEKSDLLKSMLPRLLSQFPSLRDELLAAPPSPLAASDAPVSAAPPSTPSER